MPIADAIRNIPVDDVPIAILLFKKRLGSLGLFRAMQSLDAVASAACEELAERELSAKVASR